MRRIDMKMKSFLPRHAFAVVMAAALLAACSRTEQSAEPVRAVRTVVVGSGVSIGLNEFSGEVRARVESRLGFRVGGKIVRRLVDLGQPVRAGQLLAQLDAQDLKLGQDSARAGLVAAQANYDQSVADLKRFKELRAQGFISAAELERRETGLKAAEASLLQARAQSSVQGNQTSYANLEAGAAGVITGVDAEVGQVVGAGTPVIRLAHDGPRDVVFSVPEDRAAWVRARRSEQRKTASYADRKLGRLPVKTIDVHCHIVPAEFPAQPPSCLSDKWPSMQHRENTQAMIMSGKMLFEWLGRKRNEPKAALAAQLMDAAMDAVIAEGSALTADLGGRAGTTGMGDAVASAVGTVQVA